MKPRLIAFSPIGAACRFSALTVDHLAKGHGGRFRERAARDRELFVRARSLVVHMTDHRGKGGHRDAGVLMMATDTSVILTVQRRQAGASPQRTRAEGEVG